MNNDSVCVAVVLNVDMATINYESQPITAVTSPLPCEVFVNGLRMCSFIRSNRQLAWKYCQDVGVPKQAGLVHIGKSTAPWYELYFQYVPTVATS